MPLKKISLAYEGSGAAAPGDAQADGKPVGSGVPCFKFTEVARLPEDGDNVAIARR